MPAATGSRAVPKILARKDAHGLAQALDRVAKSKSGMPGGDLEEAATSDRVARELVVVSTKNKVGWKALLRKESDARRVTKEQLSVDSWPHGHPCFSKCYENSLCLSVNVCKARFAPRAHI